jgi:Carbohydrate-selective porin, OprB family
MMNRQLNWRSMTIFCLSATLFSICDPQAAKSSSNPSNLSISTHSSPQLIALRKKKHLRKKHQPKAKITATSPTEIAAPTVSQLAPPNPPELTPTTPPAKLLPIDPPAPSQSTPTPATTSPNSVPATPTLNQFSENTKLFGSVIFGVVGNISGDYSRNTAFGNRTRLELRTNIGGGVLTTRLQAVGLGLSNRNPNANTTAIPTNEGSLSWTDGTTSNSIGIDALKYEYPLTASTQLVVNANAGAADDFTDTINPFFDGDGASGSISAFGNRPSIYYTVQGTGAGIRHKLSDRAELSLGYLARNGNNPSVGNGLFGGGYGALAQISYQTSENSKIGLTYTRTYNSDPGTGSVNANLGGISNNIGVEGFVQLSPEFALGGWAGYTQNQPLGGGDRQIWTWAITAAAPNLGGKGNLAGLLVGQEPRVTSATDGTADTKAGLHLEGFYQFKVSENISITPGIIYLTAPNQDANSSGAVIGAVRTTFTF